MRQTLEPDASLYLAINNSKLTDKNYLFKRLEISSAVIYPPRYSPSAL